MLTDCMIEDKRWAALGLEDIVQAAVSATLTELGYAAAGFEVSVLACNDTRIATLNADFRGKPQPTNVLSWPSQERGAATAGEPPLPPDLREAELGDIAIAYDTCAAEAEAEQKPMPDHATHLIVHATLHLLGYDHERDADAALMEGIETKILGKMGIADPYNPSPIAD